MWDEYFRLFRKLIRIIEIIVFRDKPRNLRQCLFPGPSDVGLAEPILARAASNLYHADFQFMIVAQETRRSGRVVGQPEVISASRGSD